MTTKAKKQPVPINRIRTEACDAVRARRNPAVSQEYARTWEEMPPPVAFTEDGETFDMADGGYRLEAARIKGLEEIECEVRQGGLKEAKDYAATANREGAVRRNDDDLEKVVQMVCATEEWRDKSNAAIADYIRCAQGTVAKYRPPEKAEEPANGASANGTSAEPKKPAEPKKRLGRDNKMHPASKPKAPKNGEVKFSPKEFDDLYGRLYRFIDKVGGAYKAKDTPQAEELRRALVEFKKSFARWQKDIAKAKR